MTTPVTERTAEERKFFESWGHGPDSLFWHNVITCAGTHCVIHNPSDHPMRQWRMVMRETTLIERQCQHGIGHPDPDSARALDRLHYEQKHYEYGFSIHGCDGCCTRQPKTIRENW